LQSFLSTQVTSKPVNGEADSSQIPVNDQNGFGFGFGLGSGSGSGTGDGSGSCFGNGSGRGFGSGEGPSKGEPAHEAASPKSCVGEVEEPALNHSSLKKAFKKAADRMNSNAASNPQRAHLEAGIYRKKIEAAYFDATAQRGMSDDDQVREAV